MSKVLTVSVFSGLIVFSLIHADENTDFWALPQCGNDPHLMQVRARHLEGTGVGFNRGYSSLDAFIPFYNSQPLLSFFDIRGHVFNDGNWAANGGVGLRGLAAKTVFGVNAFYDFRKTHHFHFNQIGAGLEALGDLWEVRLNGYFPVGRHKHFFDNKFYKFQGHSAIFREKCEFSFIGTDLEVGSRVFKTKYVNMHAFLDGYYFSGKFGKHAWGGMGKLRVGVTPYVSLQGNVSYDSLFKWRGSGELSLNFPFGGRKKISPCQVGLEQRFTQPVDRFEIIVEDRVREQEVALDPFTDQPLNFIFVDNLRGASDGSFENPFISLLEAQTHSNTGDVIYVFPGDGTTNHMNQGIFLKDNQYFIGSDFSFAVRTSSGIRTIPAQTTTPPLITNLSGDGVTLANNNQVSGFHIDQTLNNGIVGTAIAGATITNNLITNVDTSITPNLAGINLTGPGMSDIFIIQQNFISGGVGEMQGLFITPMGTDVCTVNIIQNSMTTFRDTIQMKPFNTSFLFTNVVQNLVTCTGDDRGFFLESHNSSQLTYAISNNSFASAADTGLLIQGRDASFATGSVSSNQFINSPAGLHINPSTATYFATVIGNFFANNGTTDFEGDSTDLGGYLCLSLIDNRAPSFGYDLSNSSVTPSRVFNLQSFIGNIGPLSLSGPITEFPACPAP